MTPTAPAHWCYEHPARVKPYPWKSMPGPTLSIPAEEYERLKKPKKGKSGV